MIFRDSQAIKIINFLLVLTMSALPALSQEKENVDNPNASVIETSVKPASVLYEPNNRRDPFFHITPQKTASKVQGDVEIARGTPPPGIAGTSIDQTGLEGIVIRSDNRRTAIIRGADNRAYFLNEGDRLFDGYLESIQDDSVIFVRETFMRSGKVLTQEITKRLRKS